MKGEKIDVYSTGNHLIYPLFNLQGCCLEIEYEKTYIFLNFCPIPFLTKRLTIRGQHLVWFSSGNEFSCNIILIQICFDTFLKHFQLP